MQNIIAGDNSAYFPSLPFTSSILTAIKGKVHFIELVEGENVREEIDKLTGHAHKIVIEPLGSGKRIPTIVIMPPPVMANGEGACIVCDRDERENDEFEIERIERRKR